jgi:hypothetical protein
MGLAQRLPDPFVGIYQCVQRSVELPELAVDPRKTGLSTFLPDLGALVEDESEHRHEDARAGSDDCCWHQTSMTDSPWLSYHEATDAMRALLRPEGSNLRGSVNVFELSNTEMDPSARPPEPMGRYR